VFDNRANESDMQAAAAAIRCTLRARTYQAGSNYDTIVPCLNTSRSAAGQFGSFSCGSGVGLLNEDVKLLAIFDL
jgi:hypothetical protein